MGGPSVNPAACNLTETNQANINANASICPAGWRLPTGQPTTGEFTLLNNEVNGGLFDTDLGLLNTWLGVYAGWFDSTGLFGPGNFLGAGFSGFYWSSTLFTAFAGVAYFLTFTSADVSPSGSGFFNDSGLSIRCVQ